METLRVQIKSAGYLENRDTIRNINFIVNSGELVGLIGPNGAGKSTVIKAITGLLPEIKGEISFLGKNRTYAYIPEQPLLYDDLTLQEHLELIAAVFEMDRQYFVDRSTELLDQFNLTEERHYFPATFSKGMQQKTMIIIGLLIRPDIYIIDEPFIGLDPYAVKQFTNLLQHEKTQGASMLVSTHQLDIAERICDSIILMTEGRLVSQGNLDQIRERCHLPNASLFDCFNYILENNV